MRRRTVTADDWRDAVDAGLIQDTACATLEAPAPRPRRGRAAPGVGRQLVLVEDRPTRTRLRDADATARLGRQCDAILARLRSGPATNSELSGIALKYTSRISDLRAAGYDVRVIERDVASGLHVYALRGA